MGKETLEQTLKRLKEGVQEILHSEKYRDYLRAMSRFHQYSVNNCILIAMQCPDATCVAGYTTWKSLGRYVKRGERGIRILAPCPIKKTKANTEIEKTGTDGKAVEEDGTVTMLFRAVTVFDYAQTEGEPLPSLEPNGLIGECECYEALMRAIESICSVPIRLADIPGDAKGYFDLKEQEIVIQSGMSPAQTVKTALHELCHSILHGNQKIAKDRYQAETEAESVAFVISAHFGLDTAEYSFPYLAGWSSSAEGKEILESLDIIRKTADALISDLETAMQKTANDGIQGRSAS